VHPWSRIRFIASPLSVAESRRIARLNVDAGDAVAHLLLSRLTLCLRFNAPFAGGCADLPDEDRWALVCACAPIVNASESAVMSEVRI
jgi:hypothetical protein